MQIYRINQETLVFVLVNFHEIIPPKSREMKYFEI